MPKTNSPYSAAITGGGFLFEETINLLPLLMSPEREKLLKEEALNNNILHINSETSRKRNISEIKRRFETMPNVFWADFLGMSEEERRVALFYVILKTYKICFDFHINVTLKRWNSVPQRITLDDLKMEMSEICANDEFVDGWSDETKYRVESAYLSILRKVGLLDRDNNLQGITCTNFGYYLNLGEAWFLEACLLHPYQIDQIRKKL
jgi:hypothetical protein